MFPREIPDPPKRRNHDLPQFGLTKIPDDFDPTAGNRDNDAGENDLQTGHEAIVGGDEKLKPKPKPKAQLLPAAELDRMIADSLKDIGSDDDIDEENDTDLLGELQDITAGGGDEDVYEEAVETTAAGEPTSPQLFLPTSTMDAGAIIVQRIQMYKQAEANAKTAGESTKARRFTRGLKTLNDLLKQAKAGEAINVDDIPPEVSVKGAAEHVATAASVETPSMPTRAAPSPPKISPSLPQIIPSSPQATPLPEASNSVIEQMRSRQRDYKAAVLQSQRDGDTATSLQFLKVVSKFDMVIKMCEDGQEVDLSDMPPPPEEFLQFMKHMQDAAETPTTTVAEDTPTPASH